MVAQAVRQRKGFSGLRPVDHSRDMGQLAALMEEAFGGNLTRQGREALRELKIMSHFGPFLWLLDRISPEFHETFRGFVWVEEGRIVGNVNVGRVGPYSPRWLISNVAVRPDYQGQGIAHYLVQAAIDLAREHGGKWAILQVYADNAPACKLYQHLGFEQIAAVTELRLERVRPVAFAPAEGFVLRRRSYSKWREEYALALAATSKEAQWLNPLRAPDFMVGLDQRLSRWLSDLTTGHKELRLAVEEGDRFAATLTVQASRWRGEHSLELMVHPDYRGQLEEMLVTKALNILGSYPERGVAVSHPAEHQEAIEVLKRYGFIEKRTQVQMRRALSKGAGETRSTRARESSSLHLCTLAPMLRREVLCGNCYCVG
ncbi:MAG: GNAT family N-acetyltransferase [Chloroflexi bacterium]|nr:GNAT family N-acetyltransferase [Chloroflexota bacterium]